MKAARNSASMLCQPSRCMKNVALMEISRSAPCDAEQAERAGVVLHVDE